MTVTALGVHVFAGGFTLGMQQAKVKVLAQLEPTGYGADTAAHNLGIQVLSGPAWRNFAVPERPIDIVYGNPPCAVWSMHGVQRHNWQSWEEDERLGCIQEMRQVWRAVDPDVFVFESVMGAYTRGRSLVENITREAWDRGYAVTHFLHDANAHGSVQKRIRYMFIAHRVEIPWAATQPPEMGRPVLNDIMPRLTRAFHNREEGDEPWKPSPDLWALWAPLIEQAPRPPLGRNWLLREAFLKAYPELRRGRPLNRLHRPPLNRHTMTMTQPMVIHPNENRFLTLAEMQVVMGFPVGYKLFARTHTGQVSLMARGLCPSVAKYLGKALRRGIKHRMEATQAVHVFDTRKKQNVVSFNSPDAWAQGVK